MDKQNAVHDHRAADGYVHFIEWLDEKLYGVLGPPDIGPYNEVVAKVSDALCPVCGSAMSLHTIDHSTRNPILNCPTEHHALPDEVAVNEFGMPLRR
ncbi:hypothetical protein [Galbitalea soli]|uniref:Uncharacterized protein n=1 Tax=Galbitalea soli TaxID=1268042 RepID=A0A7C9PM04_9MICO|nr:hypothetical protein [Galbitalea soli]NEM90634.1 hypothetical protein [Galbitalea soli]NYJ31352.1 hypothetical protein [Galbitalea soli]